MTLKKKIFLSTIIFGVLVLFLILFLIWPLFSKIKENSENFISQKKKFLELEKKVETLKKFQAFYKNYQANFEKIENLFVDQKEPLPFIKFLEEIAKTSQISLEIAPGTSQKIEEDFWPSMNFQMNLTGSFPNFLKFLEKLEQGPYLIEILNLNVAKLSEKDIKPAGLKGLSQGDVKASLLIKVFTK